MALAHNRFGTAALGRFHGIHGFDPHGFNRNAFGGMRGWNHWGHRYWGAGWNNWGTGWGYWAGPVFWPYFYGDVLTFALWPYDLYDPFFAYGPDYLLTSIFWPGPLIWPYNYDYAYGDYPLYDIYAYPAAGENYYGYYHRRHHRHYRSHVIAKARLEAAASIKETCGGLAPGVADLPIDRIRKEIKATDRQVAMLNELQAASTRAAAIMQASCPSEIPLTPVGRLTALSQRLQAMIQAVQTLRAPLTTFYDSLDDQQKKSMASLGRRGRQAHAQLAMSEAPARDLAALCKPQTGAFTLLPVQRIEQTIKPTAEQQKAFEALKSVSSTAAANLGASCPSDVPETMTNRLDAVVKRLQALTDAATVVKPALAQFYDTLSDEQKARFNVIGGGAAAAPRDTKAGR